MRAQTLACASRSAHGSSPRERGRSTDNVDSTAPNCRDSNHRAHTLAGGRTPSVNPGDIGIRRRRRDAPKNALSRSISRGSVVIERIVCPLHEGRSMALQTKSAFSADPLPSHLLGGNEDVGQSPVADSPLCATSARCRRSPWGPPVPVAVASSLFTASFPEKEAISAAMRADRFQILRMMPARRGRQALQCVHPLIRDRSIRAESCPRPTLATACCLGPGLVPIAADKVDA
ncbi:hypothetical protein ABIE35_003830 [Paenarthrobacter sp. 4246]